ncbi:UNVERIFIED_CONTAM: Retrovirus-related Pol polyprotein from transposon TNT 1-94 [Sesamum calycinum]|uniref:Retrovirus-related Pol polyprotein from transposon TNT 1-94 n=1 Tax=Sesamum calycinum TaxID=2727403 RepID=A0AAW2K7E9_9LAMI
MRIVLDFENQGYVLDKPLPTVLLEGSSPKERITFEKWVEDNHKVCSIILASMTNDIQKVKMLFLVEKLEDLKVGLDNDTYIDVILQSLLPSYDPFIINYNMNDFEKSIHELINILVQYKATTHKSAPVVLVGEASTSKAKDMRARCWKRKKGKGNVTTTTASTEGAHAAASEKGKGKGKVGGSQRSKANDIHALPRKGALQEGVPTAPLQPSLEIDDLDNLPTCISCLKGKMTKKPFSGQSTLANGLLDLIHSDICGPLNTTARGGFSYFITFTDDHSRYSYVYLMRYKSEVFERFKQYKLKVENQTSHNIKAFRSDKGGEYLSGQFLDYLKENGILSQWTPLGTSPLNGMAGRRNET